jgi:hypothetical protein
VLTAHHVAFQCLPPFDFRPASTDKLGFGLASVPHAFEIEMQYLVPHEIGKPVSAEYGPDLLFIEIPKSDPRLNTIRAKYPFWNVSVSPNKCLSDCYKENECVWGTAGFPEKRRKNELPSNGFTKVLGFECMVGITGVEMIHQKEEFDYFDTYANFTGRADIPDTFKGESGGGLWNIPISIEVSSDQHKTFQVGSPIFAGVIFYEGPINNNRRLIRSHGAKSIYAVFKNKMGG